MREFDDETGERWMASVERRDGKDYQGRYHFVARPASGSGEPVALGDIRWNSELTARRTLETASDVELRRRLRSAVGRAGGPLRDGRP
ncbi:hypothetical protein BH23GEM11_BH23GEM11_21400 [soil metagenome]